MPVIAQRGYSALHVENGRAGFEAAIAGGADPIETGARLSADAGFRGGVVNGPTLALATQDT